MSNRQGNLVHYYYHLAFNIKSGEMLEITRLPFLHCTLRNITCLVLCLTKNVLKALRKFCCCRPLAKSLSDGVQRRFGQYLMDGELIAAAIVHPKFKTAWIKDLEQRRIGLDYLLGKVQQHVMLSKSENASITSEDSANTDVEDDFFTFRSHRSMDVTADNILSGYLSSSVSSLIELNTHPILKSVFLELNTALPASAACERMFNVPGRVFAPNRTRMTDEHFEQQLLLRLNHDKL